MYRLACITAAVCIVAASAVGLTSAALRSLASDRLSGDSKLKTYALYDQPRRH
jgi:hypothetical protein